MVSGVQQYRCFVGSFVVYKALVTAGCSNTGVLYSNTGALCAAFFGMQGSFLDCRVLFVECRAF